MKTKIFAGALVILLITLTFGAIPVNASGDGPREVHPPINRGAVFVPDEIVVKFRQDPQPFRIIKVPESKVREKIKEYSHRPDVVYAEPNYYAQAFFSPNDPFYGYQWNFGDAETSGGIGMEQAWDISTGTGVTVAVIDTGVAYENYSNYVIAPDLAGTNFVPGYDFVNNDEHPNDDHSHGTHVAGTVAQSTNNGRGVAGVAYNASIMPVKVLDENGSGTYTNVANGIRWAAENGADVINMSLGGRYPSITLENALAYAYDLGVTIVAAAGNNGTSMVSYPAAYDAYVIAVGATRYDRNLADYSNYGTSLDLVAPGGDTGDGILQNTFNPYSKNTTDFGYWFFHGTSMASPHVAGVAALLIANGNATDPDQVRSALQETALDLGTTGRDDTYGYGLVDACAALQWGEAPTEPPQSNTSPLAYDQLVLTDEDMPVVITLSAADQDGDALTYTIVTSPSYGALSGTAPNVIYTPDLDYNGGDSLTFIANDGIANSNEATVTIIINAVNDAPVADDQSVTTIEDTFVDITLTGSDVDFDPLTFSIVYGPSNGSLSDITTETPALTTYTPDNGFFGTDSFTFIANDGTENSNEAVVTITVNPVNDAPIVTISNPADSASFVSGDTITFTGTATDLEDGDVTDSLVWMSSIQGEIGTGGSFSVTLIDGDHTITAEATDNNGKTASSSINITVMTPSSEPANISVSSIDYATVGGKNNDRHLLITVTLIDDLGNPVAGASVFIDVYLGLTLYSSNTATTGSDGTVIFKFTNAPSGTYTTTVTDVTAAELTWDDITPDNSFTK